MLETFYGLDVPGELREVAARHQQHLAELVEKLQSAGVDEAFIEQSVDQLIASYRAELLAAVKRMGERRGA